MSKNVLKETLLVTSVVLNTSLIIYFFTIILSCDIGIWDCFLLGVGALFSVMCMIYFSKNLIRIGYLWVEFVKSIIGWKVREHVTKDW